MKCRALMIICAFMMAIPAFASSAEDAYALFVKGEYDAAIEMAIAAETPEGFLVAAETLSAKVMLQHVDNPNKSAKKARKWAEKALEALPGSQKGLVQYALAYGFETRTSSPFKAWRKNLPQKTEKAVQTLRTAYPDDPRGDALLGAWHLGIIRKTGAKNGKKWFGASEEDGVAYYTAAMTAAPADIVIASNFALTLLALDMEKYYDQAFPMLTALPTMTPVNAAEAEVLEKMNSLIELKDDREALEAEASYILDN